MVFTIHLNDQFTFQAYEVCDIESYDMLTTEAHPKFIAPKLFPKSLFRDGHLLSVFYRIILNSCIC